MYISNRTGHDRDFDITVIIIIIIIMIDSEP